MGLKAAGLDRNTANLKSKKSLHLKFLALKSSQRNLERLPLSISVENFWDVFPHHSPGLFIL